MGVRVVDDIDRPDYRASHYHPADFGGVLVSIDQQRSAPDYLEPYGDWMPAGPDWRAARTTRCWISPALTLTAADPDGLGPPLVGLARSAVRSRGSTAVCRWPAGRSAFAPGPADQVTAIATLDVAVADPARVWARASAAGLDASETAC